MHDVCRHGLREKIKVAQIGNWNTCLSCRGGEELKQELKQKVEVGKEPETELETRTETNSETKKREPET